MSCCRPSTDLPCKITKRNGLHCWKSTVVSWKEIFRIQICAPSQSTNCGKIVWDLCFQLKFIFINIRVLVCSNLMTRFGTKVRMCRLTS